MKYLVVTDHLSNVVDAKTPSVPASIISIDLPLHASEVYLQEHWSGFPLPSPGDLPNPGIEPGSLALRADCLLYEPSGKNEDSSNSVNCRCISTFEKAMGDPEN